MTINPKDRIEDIDARLKELPKGGWKSDQYLRKAG